MFQLSATPVLEEYQAHRSTDVLLGTDKVYLTLDRVDTRSGSWERGFKFGSITYGVLRRAAKKRVGWSKTLIVCSEFSCNHGASWHYDLKEAKKSRGKVIVERSAPTGEFAFNDIQRINSNYHGPSYKWKP